MTAAWALLMALGGFVMSHLMGSFGVGVFVGALGISWPWIVAYTFATEGAGQRSLGGEAERWTSTELRKLDPSWKVFDHLPFADGDVDHVVVGPNVVLAVETKWRSSRLSTKAGSTPEIPGQYHRQAEWAARKVRLLLQGASAAPPNVTPVLVLWGPAVRDIGTAWFNDNGVRVLIGSRAKEWRAAVSSDSSAHPDRDELIQTLQNHIDRVNPDGMSRSRFDDLRHCTSGAPLRNHPEQPCLPKGSQARIVAHILWIQPGIRTASAPDWL